MFCILQAQSVCKWFSHIDGRPRFAKLSIDDGKKVEIAAIDPDFRARLPPQSLMEFAGRILISLTSFSLPVSNRFDLPRSDLSCHHVMIA